MNRLIRFYRRKFRSTDASGSSGKSRRICSLTSYMLKRIFAVISILLSLSACTVGANLTPTEPGSDRYWMFYDRSTVQSNIAKNISPDGRTKIYEDRVNSILKSDPNTSECRVESGSVNFGEPGSSGAAIVKCPSSLPMVKDGMSNKDGSPSYRYRLKINAGI